ncbi:MerR family transcriptional regulator [Nesterenkonia salmonea]|uniref:MerR family transcriptional regulator n=1 Tax=Nesterenkonia salmonea TaxID=1804987 RepID=A0A5R9B8Y7_9MICC|nr:MerR family transcriptional regulator [Nesterenkonia salmonea]TLP94880.1 MerR family transcriptional regulator [Nesterenkonia salmonea]
MRVGELSARTGVSVRSLRYYEEKGLLSPQRTSAGHRVYATADETRVVKIQNLLRAGFCSSVIQELLPALSEPNRNKQTLASSLAAARTRLESEKQSIEAELVALEQLGISLGLAPDMHVRSEDRSHDPTEIPPAVTFDHRDRRLR